MTAAIPYLKSILEDNDIVTINEHWLHANRLDLLEAIHNDFHVVARSSKYASSDTYGLTRGQGGTAIFWRKSLGGVSSFNNISHDRFCAIRLETDNGSIMNIFSVYMPDVSSKDDFCTILDELACAIDQMEEGSQTVVCGDFNGDVGDLFERNIGKKPNRQGKQLYEFTKRYNLIPANMLNQTLGPVETFVGPFNRSTLDYIMIPKNFVHNISSTEVLNDEIMNTSDHRPVRLVLHLDGSVSGSFNIKSEGKIKWSKINRGNNNNEYREYTLLHLQPILDSLTGEMNDFAIDVSFEEVTKVLTMADKLVPRSKYKANIKPYWNENLTILKKLKVSAYRAWVDSGRPRDPLNILYVNYKSTKKNFLKTLRALAREYDENEIADIIKSTELDYKYFWRALKKKRKSNTVSVLSIKSRDGKVKHDIDGVLQVWHDHFSALCTPKTKESFDQLHYENISKWVQTKVVQNDIDDFTNDSFTIAEVLDAVKKLHKGKAPGFDSITAEHIQFASEILLEILCILFNQCINIEYVPICFRRGIQIPIFKGKNACSLDPNSYRGITLLSSFNKLFEMLLWSRLEKWWIDEKVISECQGACRKKQSSIHTAYMLQEAVAASRESGGNCFVAYFDVAKAFDSVWIDGLFRQLYDLGITGRLWRILKKGYVGFKCCVRIHSKTSESYEMLCGIHQGGFLSSIKYIAFINSLLVELQQSNLCIMVKTMKCTPVGYADDLSAACNTKNKMDKVMTLVNNHSNRWRYEYNAQKSAVLVFGEDKRSHDINCKDRNFNIGGRKVPEKSHYDHVGIKHCIFDNDSQTVDEKISKGRKTLNASTGLGVKRKGLSMSICNLIFWLVIIPITTYGAEIWTLSDGDIGNLNKFQGYAGRRFQRFGPSTPNFSSFYGLGWMGITSFICIKKLMFAFTFVMMNDNSILKKLFMERAKDFNDNIRRGMMNPFRSPTFDILKVAVNLGLYKPLMNHLFGRTFVTKIQWKREVWSVTWEHEDIFCHNVLNIQNKGEYLLSTMGNTRYLTWWYLSDVFHNLMSVCEDMSKIVCNTSKLKCDDVLLKNSTHGARMCLNCDLGAEETIFHIVMTCSYHYETKQSLFEAIRRLPNDLGTSALSDPTEVFPILMGKCPNDFVIEQAIPIWILSAEHISAMYRVVTRER